MRNLLKFLGAGKTEQDEAGHEAFTAADKVRAAIEPQDLVDPASI